MNERAVLGRKAEIFVGVDLERRGFAILAYNYKKFFGEVDIIARKKDLLVFVEVKVRKAHKAYMTELVPASKQRKIIQVARIYLAEHGITKCVVRFDVALVWAQEDSFSLEYIENAFQEL